MTHLPLPTGHSNIHESSSVGDSSQSFSSSNSLLFLLTHFLPLLRAALRSVTELDHRDRKRVRERRASSSSPEARPAVARFISTRLTTPHMRVCVYGIGTSHQRARSG